MGFDLQCLMALCNAASTARSAEGMVNWMQLGQSLLQIATPYVVQYIGEVARPQNVNMNQAFAEAENVQGFKPYEAPPYHAGNVRALLIGVNYYGTKAQLSGCVNDVRQMLASFQKIQFPVKEMAILVDEENFPKVNGMPTRANIIKYLAWLVKDAKPGDVLFMHFSGHGTQTRSNDAYEEFDQVICPVDYERAGCIVDNDLYKILAGDLPAGVRMTVLFDCCHSGSMLDLPYTFVGGTNISPSNANYHMKQIRNNNFTPADVLMISGCEDSQTSADVKNAGMLNSGAAGAGGAATQCLSFILLRTKNLSYKDTLVQTREMLKSKSFQQVPQLSASKPLDLSERFSMTNLFKLDNAMARSLPAEFQV